MNNSGLTVEIFEHILLICHFIVRIDRAANSPERKKKNKSEPTGMCVA